MLKVPAGTQVFDEDGRRCLRTSPRSASAWCCSRAATAATGDSTSSLRPARRAEPIPGRPAWSSGPASPETDRRRWRHRPAECRQVRTFLQRFPRQSRKIAGYPFTRLHPQLGVVRIDGREFVLAEISRLDRGRARRRGARRPVPRARRALRRTPASYRRHRGRCGRRLEDGARGACRLRRGSGEKSPSWSRSPRPMR